MAGDVVKSRPGELAKGADPVVLRDKMKIGPTLEGLSERYLTEVLDAHKKESTARVSRRELKLHILPALGTLKVAEIDRTDVARFRAAMKAKPVEANRSLTLLSHILTYAVETDGQTRPILAEVSSNISHISANNLSPLRNWAG
jgi:Phage integrase, N-terminal SAM-like domain